MFIFKNFTGTDKKCSGCKAWKPISEFGKEKRAINGLKPRCKACCNAYDKLFYPNIRDKKLLRDNAKYVKRIRVKKYTDDELRTIKICRKWLHRLRINKNGRLTEQMLGYTYKDLINSLGRCPNENEHIDHKVPITWFKDYSNYRLINDLRNLHILTRFENLSKNNKYAHPISFEYFELIKDEIKIDHLNKINHGN